MNFEALPPGSVTKFMQSLQGKKMADTSIHEATRRNCIKYQIEAEAMHRAARDSIIIGEIGEAVTLQHLARECAEEARMRLDRLIGVA